MNTIKAIEVIEKKNISGDELLKMKIKNIKKLAKLLRQGEVDSKELKKVWQMWGKLRKKIGFCLVMDDLKQKCFPEKKVIK